MTPRLALGLAVAAALLRPDAAASASVGPAHDSAAVGTVSTETSDGLVADRRGQATNTRRSGRRARPDAEPSGPDTAGVPDTIGATAPADGSGGALLPEDVREPADDASAADGSGADAASVAVEATQPEPEPEDVPALVPEEVEVTAAMQIEQAREALRGCPTEDGSWPQQAWTWVPPDEELAVLALDLDGDATTFGLLADYEGTSIILRVRDSVTEENLAVVKTTSSNTRVDAEIYAWRLANLLGFGALVAPTAPVRLDGEALQKMRDLLAATRYDDSYKESNRQRVVRDLDAALRDEGGYNGAIKPWIPAFSYVGALGERERLAEHAVMEFLDADGPQPDDDEVRLEQFTRLYSPRGTQRGVLAMWELAEDVSNLMLMDALMGQNDRFAGANVHFRSLTAERIEAGERRGMPIWDLGAVRLFALDNGAALRGQNGSGFSDIQGRVVSGTRVERFEPESVELVLGLARHVVGYGCSVAPSAEESDAILAFLGVTPGSDEAERARGYLRNVAGYLAELEEREGDGIYLAPLRADTSDAPGDVSDGGGEGTGAGL